MHEIPSVPEHLSDPDLIAEVTRLAALERKAIAALVSALAELDARRLYLGQIGSMLMIVNNQVVARPVGNVSP
jgi:hypothetical protein